MYGATVSKLTEKSQNDTKKGEKSNGVQRFVEQVKEQIQDFLLEKFADAAVEVNQIVKNNDCVLTV